MVYRRVNPARAGMIPINPLPRQCRSRKPRASGDDPAACQFCEFADL